MGWMCWTTSPWLTLSWRPLSMITVVTQLIARDASGGLRIRYKGTALNVSVLPASAAALQPIMPVKVPIDTSRTILSPMPGVVKSVAVAVGDQVGDGQECAVV